MNWFKIIIILIGVWLGVYSVLIFGQLTKLNKKLDSMYSVESSTNYGVGQLEYNVQTGMDTLDSDLKDIYSNQ